MKKKKWLWIGIGAVVLIVLIGANMSRSSKGKAQGVQLARVRTEDITSRVRAPGKIEPRTQVKISADIPGKVTRLAVKEGDAVRKGQLLLQLDDTQTRSSWDQSRAAVSSAQARLRDAQDALKLAESQHVRQRALFEQKLLSQAEWDQATRQIESARTSVGTARDELLRSQAALTGAADYMSKGRFVAPFDGVVSALNVEQGEIVVTGTMNNPGTQILTVSDLSRMLVKADVDETDVVDMKLGQKARITVDALPDTFFQGTVVEIGNTAKRSITSTVEGQTNFEVEVVFDQNVPQVRPGMTADVEIETATHPHTQGVPIQAVVVRTERELERAARKTARSPKEAKAAKPAKKAKKTDAVFAAEDDTVGRKDKEITGVFVVKDGVARFVPVRVGIASETMIEVFGDLKAGDVVVAGPYKALRELKPDAKVKQEAAGAGRQPKK
jgi:HlyD family secretion protein